MKNWKQGVIYKYTSPSNKIYIGQTLDEKIRKRRHRTITIKSSTKFGNALKKYGFINFKYEVLFRSEWTDDILNLQIILNNLEIKYIKEFNSLEEGYNLTSGGDGIKSFKHSDETKKKISNTSLNMSDETKLKISESSKGKVVSQETRDKISRSSIGKIMSEEAKINMSKAQKGKVYTEQQIQKYKDRNKTINLYFMKIIIKFSKIINKGNWNLYPKWNIIL